LSLFLTSSFAFFPIGLVFNSEGRHGKHPP
jgi:hypothetical protein